MKWASSISQDYDLARALEDCAATVTAELGPDAPASLAVVFASASYSDAAEVVPRILGERFPGDVRAGKNTHQWLGDGGKRRGNEPVE